MYLYIMRHGQAEPNAATDKVRQLTGYGRQQCQLSANWLLGLHSKLDIAVVSPFVRAQQTLAEVANIVPIGNRFECADIVPEGDADIAHSYIQALIVQHQVDAMLVVSHMPLVSYLLASFLPDQQAAIFGTASVARLEYQIDSGQAQLVTHFFADIEAELL